MSLSATVYHPQGTQAKPYRAQYVTYLFFLKEKKTKLKLNIFTLAHTYLQLSLIILIG